MAAGDPASIVLATSSYDLIRSEPSFQSLLRALLWSHLLVFVGFGAGMEDPNFSALRAWMRGHLGSTSEQHLRLVRAGADADAAATLHGPEERIIPWVYGAEYSELTAFFVSLAADDDARSAVRATTEEGFDESTDDSDRLRRAAAQGKADGALVLGLRLKSADQRDEAKIYLRRAARVGNAAAANTLGAMLRDDANANGDASLSEAEAWLREAPIVGDVAAAFTLGRLLSETDRADEAFDWLARAARGGHVAGAYNYAEMLLVQMTSSGW